MARPRMATSTPRIRSKSVKAFGSDHSESQHDKVTLWEIRMAGPEFGEALLCVPVDDRLPAQLRAGSLPADKLGSASGSRRAAEFG